MLAFKYELVILQDFCLRDTFIRLNGLVAGFALRNNPHFLIVLSQSRCILLSLKDLFLLQLLSADSVL